MKGGCNFPMGPLELLDLVGLDTSLAILEALYAEFRDPNYAPAPLLRAHGQRRAPRPQDRPGFYDYSPEVGAPRAVMSERPAAREGSPKNQRCERHAMPARDRPWVMRTYSGHSSARASNELYRTNLAKGQTGLSVAFDLPTQTGYDPDHPLARGEVGKVGVPVPHLGEMRTLFDGIPLEEMNTSMTINATAMWLLGDVRRRWPRSAASTPSPALRDDAERHRQGVPDPRHVHLPARGVARLTVDLDRATPCAHVPRWNPINVCPYHLQEAGATPVQEIAYGAGDRHRACSMRCASRAR